MLMAALALLSVFGVMCLFGLVYGLRVSQQFQQAMRESDAAMRWLDEQDEAGYADVSELAALKALIDGLNEDLDSELASAWDAGFAAIAKAEGRS